MASKSKNQQAADGAKALLINEYHITEGTAVHVAIRYVSTNGMSRAMSFFVIDDNSMGEAVLFNITQLVADALKMRSVRDKHDDLVVRVYGCGMDMAWHMVSNLSSALFNDDYALRSRII